MPPRTFLPILLATIAACTNAPPDEQAEQRRPLGKADSVGSCQSETEDFCGDKSAGNCWCDDSCVEYGDCCADFEPVCLAPPEEPPVLYGLVGDWGAEVGQLVEIHREGFGFTSLVSIPHRYLHDAVLVGDSYFVASEEGRLEISISERRVVRVIDSAAQTFSSRRHPQTGDIYSVHCSRSSDTGEFGACYFGTVDSDSWQFRRIGEIGDALIYGVTLDVHNNAFVISQYLSEASKTVIRSFDLETGALVREGETIDPWRIGTNIHSDPLTGKIIGTGFGAADVLEVHSYDLVSDAMEKLSVVPGVSSTKEEFLEAWSRRLFVHTNLGWLIFDGESGALKEIYPADTEFSFLQSSK